jgi:6-phosphogluconolactonase
MENVIVFEDRASLAFHAARVVMNTAAECIESSGRFTIALSGGSAARLLFSAFLGMPLEDAGLDKWFFFWADERCVPLTDSRSNYNLAKVEFFDIAGVDERNVFPVDDSLCPHAAATAYQASIESFFNVPAGKIPAFDMILLGLGEDGHTASLFPGRSEIDEKQRLVVDVKNSPKPPPERVTFTLPLINAARDVLFITAGSSKTKVLEQLNELDGPDASLPASMVQPKGGALRWLVTL